MINDTKDRDKQFTLTVNERGAGKSIGFHHEVTQVYRTLVNLPSR